MKRVGHALLRYLCEHRRVLQRIKARAKDRLRRAVATGAPTDDAFSHVVIAGGTLREWADFSQHSWSKRLDDIVKAVQPEGVRWVTLVPVSSGFSTDREPLGRESLEKDLPHLEENVTKALRHVSGRVDVIVRTEVDGRRRFVDVVNALATTRDELSSQSSFSELRLAKALLAPAEAEPDLVLILGPPTQLPTSLVWELGYSELVFLDIGWNALSTEHLQMAVDDYRRRNRRFGGIDA